MDSMNTEVARVKEYIQKFEQLYLTHPGPIPHSVTFNGGNSNLPHIYISSCVHGDEIGSLPALFNMLDAFALQTKIYPGQLTVSLGNIKAMEKGVRYVEVDMNRHFGDYNIQADEALRAKELCSLIDSCDLFIDLHQTIEPTVEAFYVLSDTPINKKFARCINVAKKGILKRIEMDTYSTATTYAFRKGKPSITIEFSQKGFGNSVDQLCSKALEQIMSIGLNLEGSKNIDSLDDSLFFQPEWLHITHYQPFDGPRCHLLPGWKNLSPVNKQQLLGHLNSGEEFRSPVNGYALFPKYVERDSKGNPVQPPPRDIIAICENLSS